MTPPDATVRAVKDMVQKTFDDNVLCDIGTFGAMYQLDLANMEQPVLVSSVDGVGTKLKLAFMTGKHDTVGIDLVSHCVNDILVQGARPLFFLDYLALRQDGPLGVDVGHSGRGQRLPLRRVRSHRGRNRRDARHVRYQ